MPRKPSPFPPLRRRLEEVEERAQRYQAEGLPIPTAQFQNEFDDAVRAGAAETAEAIVKRAEALLARADQDWGWLRELLQRVDGLREIAETVGLDLARVDARVGNPRAQLLGEPMTPTSLEKAAAGASFALAVLNDAIPKYVVQEGQALGVSIRRARDRGEDVREAVAAFSALLRALQEPLLATSAARLVEARRSVARIPRAPPVAAVSSEEEEEILTEARTLARRLHRIKTRAHDATGAVRLMTQVRQALSEDRRVYGSPEEEVDALWEEVAQLTREKRLASTGPPLEGASDEDDDAEPTPEEPEEEPEDETEEGADEASEEEVVAPDDVSGEGSLATPSRRAMPIVPPVVPLLDERAGAPDRQSPDSLADGAGPRVPRPTRIAIAAAYVPPSGEPAEPSSAVPPPKDTVRRPRSRHRQ